MSYDRTHFEKLNPVYERSAPEPEQKLFSFRGQFEDDNDVMFDYFFKGWYEEEDNSIRIIEHTFMHQTVEEDMRIRYGDAVIGKWCVLVDILRPAIQDYLKITGTVHFDQKLEI